MVSRKKRVVASKRLKAAMLRTTLNKGTFSLDQSAKVGETTAPFDSAAVACVPKPVTCEFAGIGQSVVQSTSNVASYAARRLSSDRIFHASVSLRKVLRATCITIARMIPRS